MQEWYSNKVQFCSECVLLKLSARVLESLFNELLFSSIQCLGCITSQYNQLFTIKTNKNTTSEGSSTVSNDIPDFTVTDWSSDNIPQLRLLVYCAQFNHIFSTCEYLQMHRCFHTFNFRVTRSKNSTENQPIRLREEIIFICCHVQQIPEFSSSSVYLYGSIRTKDKLLGQMTDSVYIHVTAEYGDQACFGGDCSRWKLKVLDMDIFSDVR